ncbi:hypothetical protein [Cohnella zeiphila]|uniref:Uncharacterized protein n=1 Tax=Cohnella zeiphila TaxID=2761120 RepID=A0A7X0VWG8_9BACL|nr:hypothetical protein [Cohnella zeiphila]MBB6733194.1 hypothetical protein [Cohnella zeiphila]
MNHRGRNRQEVSKAEVQSTKLNRMPSEEQDTEFSAEQAAEAFEQCSSSSCGCSTEQSQR